jgi:uncharacterized glyoxalase superfamily protein PhnB
MKNSIIPCLSYKDAPAAIEWLCKAFGFQKKMVVPAGENKIAHAQLTIGDSMIMINSTGMETEFSKLIKTPSEVSGVVTQTTYVILSAEEIDAHYENAKSNGAKIIQQLAEQDYGGKNFSCYDIEGHLWSFGSYDPWTDN